MVAQSVRFSPDDARAAARDFDIKRLPADFIDDPFPYYRALREHADLVEPILARIRDEGALPSRAFEGEAKSGMWNWKPAKMVLEALWDRGVLVTAGRRTFQRHYDLAERVLVTWLALDVSASM